MGKLLKFLLRLLAKVIAVFSSRTPLSDSPEKIFLLMCDWLGDTFWAMQVIPAVKRQYPEAEIFIGCKSHSVDLFHGLVERDNIMLINNVRSDRRREKLDPDAYRSELNRVRSMNFDIAIDLTANRYAAWFLYKSGIPYTVGLDTNELSALYSLTGPEFDYERHLHFRPWETVRTLFDCSVPESLFPPDTNITKDEIFTENGLAPNCRLALIAPGAGWEDKQWPPENFLQCARFMEEKGFKVVISGTKGDKSACKKLANNLNNPLIFIHPLTHFIALIKELDFALVNDSGPAHLLAAANIPTVTIFLATDPQKCAPIGKSVHILERDSATIEKVEEIISSL